jgi:hypothetical protein
MRTQTWPTGHFHFRFTPLKMTNNKVDKIEPSAVWQEALGELQLQLTGATFDTWLRRSSAVAFEGDTLIVAVHNQYAQDWLENRLLSTIERTLTGIVGRTIKARFVVRTRELPAVITPDAPSAPAIAAPTSPSVTASPMATPAALPEMPALGEVGFFPVSRYECTFWAPHLGRVAWRVWEIVRAADVRREKSEWTNERRWSAPALARLVPCGSQAVAGVTRANGRQAGALERLAEVGVGQYRRQGDPRDPHTIYVVQVRVRLPLLTPVAVMQLSETLRLQHDRWLEEYGFDPRAWFVE